LAYIKQNKQRFGNTRGNQGVLSQHEGLYACMFMVRTHIYCSSLYTSNENIHKLV